MADGKGLPALVAAIEEIGAVAADLAEAARGVNSPELGMQRAMALEIAETAALLAQAHSPRPGIDIADALAGLAAIAARLPIPARDSELGRSAGLGRLQSLNLRWTQVSDVGALAGIKGLRVVMPDGSERRF